MCLNLPRQNHRHISLVTILAQNADDEQSNQEPTNPNGNDNDLGLFAKVSHNALST